MPKRGTRAPPPPRFLLVSLCRNAAPRGGAGAGVSPDGGSSESLVVGFSCRRGGPEPSCERGAEDAPGTAGPISGRETSSAERSGPRSQTRPCAQRPRFTEEHAEAQRALLAHLGGLSWDSSRPVPDCPVGGLHFLLSCAPLTPAPHPALLVEPTFQVSLQIALLHPPPVGVSAPAHCQEQSPLPCSLLALGQALSPRGWLWKELHPLQVNLLPPDTHTTHPPPAAAHCTSGWSTPATGERHSCPLPTPD